VGGAGSRISGLEMALPLAGQAAMQILPLLPSLASGFHSAALGSTCGPSTATRWPAGFLHLFLHLPVAGFKWQRQLIFRTKLKLIDGLRSPRQHTANLRPSHL
jgi:hypothetical protein